MPKFRKLIALVPVVGAVFLSSFCGVLPASAAALNICEREMIAASGEHKVPLGVLYAVGLTETGRKGRLSPYALNIEGKTVFTDSEADAMKSFKNARRSGVKLIDLGCMQINHHYHGADFSSVEEMLDPHKNVAYAAKFLSELRVQEGSWTMAVARYHAGPNNNPAQKRYVCMVIRNLVASNFGAWTPEAKRFCR
jgi:soluble lytic murein transglycosylase-like protein